MENSKNNLYVIIALLSGLILGYVVSNSGIIGFNQAGQTIKGADIIVRDDSVSKKIYTFDQKQVSEIMSGLSDVVKKNIPESTLREINSSTGLENREFVVCLQNEWNPSSGGWTTYAWTEYGSVGNFGGYICLPLVWF